MALRIGFDLDGVLADMEEAIIREATMLFGPAPSQEPQQPASQSMADVMPRETADDAPLPHLLRGLTRLADRDVQRRYIESIVSRAGLDLSAAAAWLLHRIERDPHVDPDALAHAYSIEPARLREALGDLRGRGLVMEVRRVDGDRPGHELTPAGCDLYERLVVARRARLAELFADWPSERHEELAAILRRLATELVPHHVRG